MRRYNISLLFAFSNGVKVWSFGAAATAALAGLMGEMIYSPYDITGNWTFDGELGKLFYINQYGAKYPG